MCKFFSLLSSGDGRVYYFSPEQRIAGVKMPNGRKCFFDDHTSIAGFYGLDEDECNKWEYNPFSRELVLDMQLTADDREAVLEEIAKINFDPICGDVEGTREFIKHLKTMKILDGHGGVPDDVKMFETMEEARDVAEGVARDVALDTAWNAADDAVREAACDTSRDAAWDATWNVAWCVIWWVIHKAVCSAAYDATLFIQLIYVCPGLPIDQKHIDHIKKRWSVWEAGYGVYCDVDGVLYCYKNQ